MSDLTPREVADRLRLNVVTVRKMLRDGHLRGFKTDGYRGIAWTVREADLLTYIREHHYAADQSADQAQTQASRSE